MNEEDIWRHYLPAGFTARPTTLADAEAATALFDASNMKYTGQRLFSMEQTLTFWQSSGFNLAKNSRVVLASDGRIAAQIDLEFTKPIPARPRVWGRVHPDYEGLGIGTALLAWAEQSARKLFPLIPVDVRIALFVVRIPETAVSTHQLLSNCGYRHVRDFWRMVIELEQEPQAPIWPPDITLSNMIERPDMQAVAAVREEAFRDHWGHVEQSLAEATESLQHWLENDSLHEPAGELLAMAGEEIAGICLCSQGEYSDPEMGWVNTLAVRRPYRGQGVGLALLRQSFCNFYKRGFKRAGLTVDANSLTGATRLYEKAGMHVQSRYLDFEKELRPGREITTHE